MVPIQKGSEPDDLSDSSKFEDALPDLPSRNCLRVVDGPQPALRYQIGIPEAKLIGGHVVTVTANSRADLVQKLAGAMKRRGSVQNSVDVAAGIHDGVPFLKRHDRRLLVTRRVMVADQTDHEPLAERARLFEKLDMAGVKQIAHHVGVNPLELIAATISDTQVAPTNPLDPVI